MSAKFHIIGERGHWFRIRVQEEIYAHGLEGGVLIADDQTLAIIVDGDKSKIKRLYTDLDQVCPDGVQCTDLTFSPQKPIRSARIKDPEIGSATTDHVMDYLREIERKTTKIDQKLQKVLNLLQQGKIPPHIPDQDVEDDQSFEDTSMEVEEDAATGFAAMFGD